MKTAIVTDSNSGIFEAEGQEMGVFVLPMPVLIDHDIYFEGQNISSERFYQCLQTGKSVTTSQPSPGDLTALWDQVLENGYDELVYIPMSSGLSSSCATAKILAEDYARKGIPFQAAAAGSFLSDEDAEEWKQLCQELFPDQTPHYDPLTCCIGCHVGPDAFGMAVTRRLCL